MCRVVVREFCKGQEIGPIVLLVVDVDAKVLFEDLVNAFGLSIGLRVVSCGEVRFDIEQLA